MQAIVPWRRRALTLVACALGVAATGAGAAPAVAGRWEGEAAIPGWPLRLVVDLDRDARGQWAGSAILPGRGVKGAPLDALVVAGCDVRFGLAAAFAGGGAATPPRVALACQADGTLAGTFFLGGLGSAIALRRSGPAQVDRPPANSVIDASLAGHWTGRYELGGVTRELTLTLANRGAAGGGGQLVIVGQRTTTLDVDQVRQGRAFVTLRASAADFRIEGRFSAADGVIEGAVAQGPDEAPLVLRRQAAAGEKAS